MRKVKTEKAGFATAGVFAAALVLVSPASPTGSGLAQAQAGTDFFLKMDSPVGEVVAVKDGKSVFRNAAGECFTVGRNGDLQYQPRPKAPDSRGPASPDSGGRLPGRTAVRTTGEKSVSGKLPACDGAPTKNGAKVVLEGVLVSGVAVMKNANGQKFTFDANGNMKIRP